MSGNAGFYCFLHISLSRSLHIKSRISGADTILQCQFSLFMGRFPGSYLYPLCICCQGAPGWERCGADWRECELQAGTGHAQPSSLVHHSEEHGRASDGECESVSAALTSGLACVLSKRGNRACNLSALQMCPQEGCFRALIIFLSI